MILMDKNMDGLEKQNMLSEVDKIDGVKMESEYEFSDRAFHSRFHDSG